MDAADDERVVMKGIDNQKPVRFGVNAFRCWGGRAPERRPMALINTGKMTSTSLTRVSGTNQ